MSVALLEPREDAPDAPRMAADTLAASMALLLALAAVQPLVGFVRGLLFCRWLAPDELGRWDLAFGFLTVAGPLVDLGLPASMGRFAERYRRRGHLTALLRWAGAIVLSMATAGAVALFGFAPRVAALLYNDDGQAPLVRLIAVCLLACVAFGFQVELLAGLRMFRVVSLMQLGRSVAFLALGAVLVGAASGGAGQVVAAYGAASLAAAASSLYWLRRRLPPTGEAPGPLAGAWTSVLPLALWVSLTNALSNLFDVADRNLIVHLSGLPSAEALDLVGNYHSSRVVPLMFVTLGAMLSSVLLPHLAYPWESGDRVRAGLRLNLVLKLFAVLLTVGSLVVLAAAPWLYDVALEHKFAQARELLPWTLAYSSCFGLALLAGAALICTERARVSTLVYAGALTLDVALNFWLIPTYGLIGAAWASTAARLAVLVVLFRAAGGGGLPVRRGTWLMALLPMTAIAGWPAVVAGLLAASVGSPWLVAADERELLAHAARRFLHRLLPKEA